MKTYKFLFEPEKKYSVISYETSEKRFVAEASELKLKPGEWFGECVLINISNNHAITFSFKNFKKTNEGEIVAWVFKSTEGAKFPCEFHILND